MRGYLNKTDCLLNLLHYSMGQSKANYSIYGLRLFKFALAAFAFYFVYLKVLSETDSRHYLNELKTAFSQSASIYLLILVIVLMFFNWLVEAWKWKIMIERLESISLARSFEAVFSGLTVSIFTPNRIGEYAGRVFHLAKADKIQATLVTVVENFSQLIITLLMGSLASFIYFKNYTDYPFYISFGFTVMLVIVSLISLVAFFNISLLDKPLSKIKWLSKKKAMFHVLSDYTSGELAKVILGALLRYFIFTLQFYLLLRVFNFHESFLPTITMIAMTYLVITLVPTFLLTEIGVRGAAAVYFFSMVSYDNVPVLNAVFSLWIINLGLPALIGAIFMLNFRFEKKKAE